MADITLHTNLTRHVNLYIHFTDTFYSAAILALYWFVNAAAESAYYLAVWQIDTTPLPRMLLQIYSESFGYRVYRACRCSADKSV